MSTISDKLLEYSMPHTSMSTKLQSFMAVFFVTSIIFFPSNSASLSSNDIDEFSLEISTDTGNLFENFINISGHSSVPLSELVWTMNHIIQHNNPEQSIPSIMSSSTFTDVQVHDDIYFWELSIPVNELNCTCSFSIAAPNIPELEEQSIVLFVGQSNHFSVITHKPNFQNIDNLESKLLFYEVLNVENDEFDINGVINEGIFMADICQYSGNSCVSATSQIVLNHTLTENGLYTVELNQDYLGLVDGNWHFEIFLRDSFLILSNVDKQVLTFDTTPPLVEILGSGRANEMESEVLAVSVDDGYDSSLVALTWTITEPNGVVRGLISDEYISDSSVEIQFNQSGTWNISVLAIDSVGHYAKQYHEVIVENLAPRITLTSSSSQSTNALIIVSEVSEVWYVDASMTQDTANDIDDLVFHWYVNDEIIHVGKNLSYTIFTETGSHDVTLIVTDNDGLSTESLIEIVIVSDAQSKTGGVSIPLLLLSIALLCLTVMVIFRYTKEHNSVNLPKWGK